MRSVNGDQNGANLKKVVSLAGAHHTTRQTLARLHATPAVSCTRDGADWPKVVAVGAQQPISDFFGFIQIRDTLSTNGEHHRVAEVKSFPAIPKLMRSVNGDQNGANLKKWSVLLVCTIETVTRIRTYPELFENARAPKRSFSKTLPKVDLSKTEVSDPDLFCV